MRQYWVTSCICFPLPCAAVAARAGPERINESFKIEDLRYLPIFDIFDLRYRRSSISQIFDIADTSISKYKTSISVYEFNFDIEVIFESDFDIGLLRCQSLLRYRSIFNIKVLRYRSLNISISRFCEIRDFDIVVDGLRYPSPISDPISKSK